MTDKPGWFTPPFKPGWTYQGTTYAGHSDFATDFNRRTPSGGWLDDRGDPVLAMADGVVKSTDPQTGFVVISHDGGYASEYGHMQPVRVKPGDRVKRGDIIGNIGEAGNAPNGTHLHLRTYRNGKPIQLRFEGKPIRTSVLSDQRPADWKPPAPVMVQGQPLPETPEETIKRLRDKLDAQKAQTDLFKDERDQARRELATAKARIAELEARPDCHEAVDEAVRLRDVLGKVKALVTL